MGEGVISPDIESTDSSPYTKLVNYLKEKGEIKEKDGKQVRDMSRKGILRIHLSLPIIGDIDRKGIQFQISEDVEKTNSDINIHIVDLEADEKSRKKSSAYEPTIITIPSPQSGKPVEITNPNNLWKWFGLNKRLWNYDPEKGATVITYSQEEADKIVTGTP